LETVRDKAKAKKWVPPLLQKFLQCPIKDEVKQVALGHSIVQSCLPRSVVAPVLFGVGVSVDHVLGAQWLLKVLNTLGFSLSVEEVIRYKQSVVRAEGSDKTPIGRDVISQWAGDNVDHNVKTLDGSQSFHGMGNISMSVGGHPDEYLEIPVKRLTRIKVGNLIKGRGMPIMRSTMPDESPSSKIVFSPFANLQIFDNLTRKNWQHSCLILYLVSLQPRQNFNKCLNVSDRLTMNE